MIWDQPTPRQLPAVSIRTNTGSETAGCMKSEMSKGHGRGCHLTTFQVNGMRLKRGVIDGAEDMLSLVELKSSAAKYLKDDSIAKSIIMSEADMLPREEAAAKLAVFLTLLGQELSGYRS
jgi:hypothetical protein